MELILLRHGEVPGNRQGRFIGVTDQALTPEGIRAARTLSEAVQPVERVYRSPLLRCAQTASLVWPGIPQTVISQLRETDFGPFEGRSAEELEGDPLYRSWLRGEVQVGEPPEAASERAWEGLRLAVSDAAGLGLSRAALVTHGGTIMALLARLGLPRRSYYWWACPNCGGYVTALEPDGQLRVLGTLGEADP